MMKLKVAFLKFSNAPKNDSDFTVNVHIFLIRTIFRHIILGNRCQIVCSIFGTMTFYSMFPLNQKSRNVIGSYKYVNHKSFFLKSRITTDKYFYRSSVFSVVTQSLFVIVYQHFGRSYWPLHQVLNLFLDSLSLVDGTDNLSRKVAHLKPISAA
jgi:hypothetical protein